MVFDYRKADLPSGDRVLCDYAVKLTLTPGQSDAADIDHLKSAGWTEEQITVAVQVIGYFNYINRVADGLGVDDESWMELSKTEWLARKGQDWMADGE